MKVAGYWRLKGTLYRMDGILEAYKEAQKQSDDATRQSEMQQPEREASAAKANTLQESSAA